MLKYTKDHEWLRLDGDVATVGITPYRAGKARRSRLRRITDVWARGLNAGAVAATVESVKAASEVYAPVSGEIVAVNDKAGQRTGAGQLRADRQRLAVQDEGRETMPNSLHCSTRRPTRR